MLRTWLICTAALSTILTVSSAMSQPTKEFSPAEVETIYRSIGITVHGNETPELVPLHVKVNHFLQRYRTFPEPREVLRREVTPEDDALLMEFATNGRKRIADRIEPQREAKFISQACSRADELPTVELAALLDRLAQEHQEAYIAAYEQELRRLSKRGELAVRQFIAQNVKPSMTISTWTDLARRSEDLFRQVVRHDCEEARSGAHTEAPAPAPSQQRESDDDTQAPFKLGR